MIFKIGDKVIINKPITGLYNVSAVVEFINNELQFYRVRHNYGREGFKNNTCNIFYNHIDESIEFDLKEMRNDKIESLGINKSMIE